MLRATKLTLALATFNPFHSNVRPAFYLPCPLVIPVEVSLMICLADGETGFLMECGNRRSVKIRTFKKERFECVHTFLLIVKFFVVCIRSSKSAVFIISLSANILLFQEGFQLQLFDAAKFCSVVWRNRGIF